MIGQKLRSYRILAKLGSGGMGEVFMAEHERLGRKVAIKVLTAAAAGDQRAVSRLLGEARAAAALRHPHIVQIYDCDVQDGRPFVAMEYLEGETLAQFLERRVAVELNVIAIIGSQIADALAAAHAKGIVHRDLKPANVFLKRDDQGNGFPWVKLLDFGIAKLLHDPAMPGALRTQSGELVGTPAYMAPEQCRGRGEIYTPADIYALGCILFEMVCGRRPFEQQGLGELISAHLNNAPPDPRQFRATLPEELRVLILAALSKAPQQRPGAQVMRDSLRALPGDRGSVHVTQTLVQPRRRRRVLMAVLLGGVAASALGWSLVSRWRRPAAEMGAASAVDAAPRATVAVAALPDAGPADGALVPAATEVTAPDPAAASSRPPRKRIKRQRPAPRAPEPSSSPYRALDD